jgi:hypothetical protein
MRDLHRRLTKLESATMRTAIPANWPVPPDRDPDGKGFMEAAQLIEEGATELPPHLAPELIGFSLATIRDFMEDVKSAGLYTSQPAQYLNP